MTAPTPNVSSRTSNARRGTRRPARRSATEDSGPRQPKHETGGTTTIEPEPECCGLLPKLYQVRVTLAESGILVAEHPVPGVISAASPARAPADLARASSLGLRVADDRSELPGVVAVLYLEP